MREAIALAFDREALVDDLLLGLTKPAATYWDSPPRRSRHLKPWPYDPEGQERLDEAAGWTRNGDGMRDKDGMELTLTHWHHHPRDPQGHPGRGPAATGGRGHRHRTCSTPEIRPLYFSGYGRGWPVRDRRVRHCPVVRCAQFPDPDREYWLCSEIPSAEKPTGLNRQSICDKELDGLFQQQRTQVNVNERQDTFHKITTHA